MKRKGHPAPSLHSYYLASIKKKRISLQITKPITRAPYKRIYSKMYPAFGHPNENQYSGTKRKGYQCSRVYLKKEARRNIRSEAHCIIIKLYERHMPCYLSICSSSIYTILEHSLNKGAKKKRNGCT